MRGILAAPTEEHDERTPPIKARDVASGADMRRNSQWPPRLNLLVPGRGEGHDALQGATPARHIPLQNRRDLGRRSRPERGH